MLLLVLILLPFCAASVCDINIHSSTGFTLQVIDPDNSVESDTVQLVISYGDQDLISELAIVCVKNCTIRDIEKDIIIYSGNGRLQENRSIRSNTLKLNIVGCRNIRAKSITNITIENCTFEFINHLGCQTVLDFSKTSATVKNCHFNLKSICNDTKASHTMIGASNSCLSIEDSLFITQNGKLLDIEQKSEVNITNTIFRDSKVTDVGDQPALIQAFKSKIKFENCTVRNNEGGLIVRARQCEQVSIDDSCFLNNSAWECTLCASQSNISFLNTNISKSSGNFSVIYLVETFANISGVNYSNNNGSFLVRNSRVTFKGVNLFEHCRQNFSLAEKYWAQGTLSVIQSTAVFFGNTCFLENYTIRSGGGMYISETQIVIHGNLTVTRNRAKENGGGAFFYGSNVFCSGKCIFTNNNASFAGGGISTVFTTIILRESDMWTHSIVYGILNISGNVAKIGAGINLEANSKIYGIESSHFLQYYICQQ